MFERTSATSSETADVDEDPSEYRSDVEEILIIRPAVVSLLYDIFDRHRHTVAAAKVDDNKPYI